MREVLQPLALLAAFLLTSGPLWAAQRPYDIYLTENRICRRCTWELQGPDTVRLTNPQGLAGDYPVREILGVDNHPVLRRLMRQSIQGTGLSGKIIVPQAFDDTRFLQY